MKPMSEAHFAILRRHMVEVIGIQVDLASEELGKRLSVLLDADHGVQSAHLDLGAIIRQLFCDYRRK
jgi:hypothetical protein